MQYADWLKMQASPYLTVGLFVSHVHNAIAIFVDQHFEFGIKNLPWVEQKYVESQKELWGAANVMQCRENMYIVLYTLRTM